MPTVTEGLIKVSIHNYVTSALFVFEHLFGRYVKDNQMIQLNSCTDFYSSVMSSIISNATKHIITLLHRLIYDVTDSPLSLPELQ